MCAILEAQVHVKIELQWTREKAITFVSWKVTLK